MTAYEFTYLESLKHTTLVEKAQALGAEGWQMVTVDQTHGFWVAYFQRERTGDAPVVHVAFEDSVLALAGGVNDPPG